MANPYKDYEEKYGKPESGGESQFLKTEGGNTYRFIILSDAYYYLNEYQGNWSDRYAWIIFNTEEKKVQILSKGVSVYKQIFELAIDEDWGYPQHGYDVKLKHQGSGMDTEYFVTPGKKLEDKESIKRLLVEAEKVDLKKILKGGVWIDEYNQGDKPQKVNKDNAEPSTKNDDVVLEDIDEEPVDLSDIPF